MDKIIIPNSFNYIEAYLTFSCNLNCSWCINKQANKPYATEMPASEWIKGLNRIETKKDLPITIGGGEPTSYINFYEVVKGVNKPMDLLTNGQFDVRYFMRKIKPNKFKRGAKYASIRFSYHPRITDLYKLIRTVRLLKKKGYEVGIWAVNHPAYTSDILFAQRIASGKFEIDFRLKEFLGVYKGKLYGTYKYPEAVDGKKKSCLCKGSELLIAPDGEIYRCHYELYKGINSQGHILDKTVKLNDKFTPCSNCGLCSYCDVKNKFNRYQQSGHCAVEIK